MGEISGNLERQWWKMKLEELDRLKGDERKQSHGNLLKVRHFYARAVGVTYKNENGSERQAIIRACSPFETVILEHEENNPHDPNAINVCRQNGEQIGYLSEDVAEEIWYRQRNDFRTAAIVVNVTGGTLEHPTLGMNILIIVARPGVSDAEAQAYLDSITPDVLESCRSKRNDEEDCL